jgi:hypothetical protein
MPIHISRLIAALRRCLWRQGFVHPERLSHEVTAAGDHHIALTLHATEVEYEAPTVRSTLILGHSTPCGPEEK